MNISGLEYLLIQSAPTCVTKLFHSLGQMIGKNHIFCSLNFSLFCFRNQQHKRTCRRHRRNWVWCVRCKGSQTRCIWRNWIYFDYIGQGFSYFIFQNISVNISKEPVTQNWAYGSNDVHLFKEQIEPYLKRLYPQTKVWKSLINDYFVKSRKWIISNFVV